MPKVLVTGGCGFIGHHFVEHALKTTDWHITVIDSLTYAGDASRLTDLAGYDPARVRLIWHDLRGELPNRVGSVDYVFNIASASHVDRSIEDPAPFIFNNVGIAVNMLEYARRTQPKKFFQISTDEVFGPAAEGVFHDEWQPHLPSNPYAASKAAQECIAISYWRTYRVPVVITRTMNNFGERQHPEKFVAKAIRAILRGEPVTVHAENRNGGWAPGSRMWLHAKNHADALVFLANKHEPGVYGATDKPSTFHIVGDEEFNNLEIAEMIGEYMGQKPKIQFEDFHAIRPGHDRRYALDGDKIRDEGWIPPFSLHESFRKMVQWYMDNQDWLLEQPLEG